MGCFKDEHEVYRYIGALFEGLVADAALAEQFKRANTIVQYRCHDPESVITVRALDGQPARVDLGPTSLEPEVVMAMAADTAHRFWLGKVNVTVAMAKGEIRATGPVAKILKLVPLVRPAFARYRARLERAGRSDLLEV